MKRKITKRDIVFFFLGLFAAFVIDVVYNWKESVQAFNDGANSALEKIETEK